MKHFYVPGIILLLLALVCTGCGPSNNVRLLYKPVVDSLPAPDAKRVVVVEFKDQRQDTRLGVRRDGSTFMADRDVPVWLSRSLADELTRLGLQVSYAASRKDAAAAQPDFVVTGVVKDVWLKEISTTELSVKMSATVTLTRDGKQILKKVFSAAQSRKGMPSGSAAEELLLDSMQELVQPAGRQIRNAMDGGAK